MSPRLAACPTCERHVIVSATECPHCGTSIAGGTGKLLKTAGAALLGLSMTACGGNSDTGGQAEYGVPDTADTGGDTGDSGNQADYGVPDTGYPDQPEYGVPDTGMYADEDGDGDSR